MEENKNIGLIMKSTGSWYTIKTADGALLQANIKGKIRMQGLRSTNPVAVGDRVCFEQGTDWVVIKEILPRKNYIVRKSTNLSKQIHILAANVDQAFLIVTMVAPQTSTMFIDRFLLSAEAYRIPVTLVFNKSDLLSEEEKAEMDELIWIYDALNYDCLVTSALKDEGITELKELLKDKISVFAGHSGVGKSTLINKIAPGLDLKTANISEIHQTGKHTTTFAEMYELEDNTYIMDTPGIRGFGIIDMEKEEIKHYFREIFYFSKECKFHNCTHMHEPGCRVVEAFEEGLIASSRYDNYYSLFLKDEDKHRL